MTCIFSDDVCSDICSFLIHLFGFLMFLFIFWIQDFFFFLIYFRYVSLTQTVKNRRCEFDSWVGKIPWRRKWQPSPVLLPGKFHGLSSLVGYSPWGRKELDTTEQLHIHTYAHLSFKVPIFLGAIKLY